MMAVWKEMTVGDLCDSISDTYRRNDNEVILVNTSDVLEGKVLNHQCVENKNLKGQFKKTFQKDDILYSEIRPANKRYAYIDFDDTEQYIASTKLMVLRPKKEIILPRFLFAFLSSNHVLMELQHLAETRSGTFPQITFSSELAPMLISVPDFATQEKTVGILNSIEERIQNNNAINENLYEQLTSYYKHLFSAITPSTSVGELVDSIFSGGTPSTSNEAYWNGDHYWLSSGETSERFIVSTIKTITDAGASNSSTRKANKYDIVIASAGQGHTRGQTSMLLTDTYVNQSIIVVHAAPDYLPYLFWNIANRYEELRVISNSNSIRGSLTTKMIGSLSIPKADITQIRQFSDYAWPIVKAVENNLHENRRLAVMRDTLLPRLMSGELDVSALDL